MGCFTKQPMHVFCLHHRFANLGKVGSASMGERERKRERECVCVCVKDLVGLGESRFMAKF